MAKALKYHAQSWYRESQSACSGSDVSREMLIMRGGRKGGKNISARKKYIVVRDK